MDSHQLHHECSATMIHALLDTTQVIATVQTDGAAHELCAEAIANHDRHTNQLTVKLRAFLRAEQHDHIGEISIPSWLPDSQTVKEHVAAEEAHDVANEVFASWCHKLAGLVPA